MGQEPDELDPVVATDGIVCPACRVIPFRDSRFDALPVSKIRAKLFRAHCSCDRRPVYLIVIAHDETSEFDTRPDRFLAWRATFVCSACTTQIQIPESFQIIRRLNTSTWSMGITCHACLKEQEILVMVVRAPAQPESAAPPTTKDPIPEWFKRFARSSKCVKEDLAFHGLLFTSFDNHYFAVGTCPSGHKNLLVGLWRLSPEIAGNSWKESAEVMYAWADTRDQQILLACERCQGQDLATSRVDVYSIDRGFGKGMLNWTCDRCKLINDVPLLWIYKNLPAINPNEVIDVYEFFAGREGRRPCDQAQQLLGIFFPKEKLRQLQGVLAHSRQPVNSGGELLQKLQKILTPAQLQKILALAEGSKLNK